MAQSSDIKLYAALGVLGILGIGYFSQQNTQKAEAEAHTAAAEAESLPELSMTEEDTKKITKVVINKPAKMDGETEKEPAQKTVLVKQGDKWMLEEPVKALANQSNVESLLKNLTKLAAKEQIADGKDAYEQYQVTEKAAVHSEFYAGDKLVRAVFAGKSGGRGQMARVDGSDAVFVIDGYSSFLYNRNTKGWRDLSIFEVDTEEVTAVSITNENGEFSFEKDGEEWSGKLKAPKAFSAKKIEEFDPKKVTSMLNAYKKLNASGFGDGKTLVETGLEEPTATLTLSMGEDKKKVVQFGNNAEGSSRWIKVEGDDQIYSISNWAAEWGTAKDEKFQKSDDPPPSPGGPPGGMPGGMPPGMMPPGGMPPGHP